MAGVALVALFAVRPWGPVPMYVVGAVLLLLVAGGLIRPAAKATSARPTGPTPPRESTLSPRARWERACARHDEVLSAYGRYELDPEMLLRFPAMWDLSAAPVVAFQDALEQASELRTDTFDRAVSGEYVDAVAALRTTWAAADRYARTTGTSGLGFDDAKDCERGLKLLRHAEGTEAAEQATYLRQVVATLDRLADRGIVASRPPARAELERRAQRAIGS